MKKKRGIISIVLISIIAVIFIIPLVYMVSTSLKPKSEVLQDTISLIGSRVTTENYERAWNAFPFARYMFKLNFRRTGNNGTDSIHISNGGICICKIEI